MSRIGNRVRCGSRLVNWTVSRGIVLPQLSAAELCVTLEVSDCYYVFIIAIRYMRCFQCFDIDIEIFKNIQYFLFTANILNLFSSKDIVFGNHFKLPVFKELKLIVVCCNLFSVCFTLNKYTMFTL